MLKPWAAFVSSSGKNGIKESLLASWTHSLKAAVSLPVSDFFFFLCYLFFSQHTAEKTDLSRVSKGYVIFSVGLAQVFTPLRLFNILSAYRYKLLCTLSGFYAHYCRIVYKAKHVAVLSILFYIDTLNQICCNWLLSFTFKMFLYFCIYSFERQQK